MPENNKNQSEENVQSEENQSQGNAQTEEATVSAGSGGATADPAASGEAGEGDQEQNRVVNNGEISDPGNSGSVDPSGAVSGSADKPNG